MVCSSNVFQYVIFIFMWYYAFLNIGCAVFKTSRISISFPFLWLIVLMLQSMRETLIYLSHLDHDDTEKQVTILLFG